MSLGVAMVTGAAQGLGRGIAGALLKEGYKVRQNLVLFNNNLPRRLSSFTSRGGPANKFAPSHPAHRQRSVYKKTAR